MTLLATILAVSGCNEPERVQDKISFGEFNAQGEIIMPEEEKKPSASQPEDLQTKLLRQCSPPFAIIDRNAGAVIFSHPEDDPIIDEASGNVICDPSIKNSIEKDKMSRMKKKEIVTGNFDGTTASIEASVMAKQVLETANICGKEVTLRSSAMEKLEEANEAMEKDGQGCIKVRTSFKSNAYQNQIYEAGKNRFQVKKPGESTHEAGLAIDVDNENSAGRYLAKVGFSNYRHERSHFYIGEEEGRFFPASFSKKINKWIKNIARSRRGK